jgi:glycolate oxidase
MQMPQPHSARIAKKPLLVAELTAALGPQGVIHDPNETRAYECDALTAYTISPMIVALPSTTEEVAAVMKICLAHDIPVVPRGSGTSLAGGALPTEDSVILGVSRMHEVLDINTTDRTIRVQTGITNIKVSHAVEELGFFYAPDPSSQLACAIAGNIGMNSGGAHCLKYGVTTNNLMGVTIVLMNGEIVELGGAYLEAEGLDLLAVICGSEGQLGIVTEATLKILPRPEGALPVLIAYSSNLDATACVSDIIKSGLTPVAIEFMDRQCLVAVERHANAGYPDCEALLIVEVEGSDADIADQLTQIKEIAERHSPIEIREATNADDAARIWLGRKSAFGAMGSQGDYICLDGTIPVSELTNALSQIMDLSEEYGLAVSNVFHAGDGNMHPLIIFDANAGQLETAEALGAEILRVCVEAGGCLSGEHGVGVEKRDLMVHQFDPIDMEYQMRIKDSFDPNWLLNPAKVFPLATSESRRSRAHPDAQPEVAA